ncbi:MAG: FAD-binding oxidoreductase [Myxococcaceae bacterium]|nr:FAD-binding oxidoreductase [Myxococcaceae bacterium]
MTDDLRDALQRLLVARFAAEADGTITLSPSHERELKAVLDLFREHRQPLPPNVRISRARMDGIGTIDPVAGTVEAGAGVPLARLEQELRQRDLSLGPLSPGMLALDLASFLEGPYAGLRVVPGGRLEALPLALTALMSDGLRFISRPSPRSAAGPDLDALFLGGEGRFGWITSATLRCFQRPRAERTAAYALSAPDAALSSLRTAVARGCWFRRVLLQPERDRVLLQAEVIGPPEGVERDLSSLAHEVFARGGRSQTPVPPAAAPALPEREVSWDELGRGLDEGRAATLYRIALDTVVVSGWTDGGLPLGGRGTPSDWANRDVLQAIAREADPLSVFGGAQ